VRATKIPVRQSMENHHQRKRLPFTNAALNP
jgi:hypothetical protein